jgi:hypothetical protein
MIVVTGVGGGLLVFGVICIVLPVPATPTILTGLVILATEHAWPKRMLQKIPQWMNRLRGNKPNKRTAATTWVKGLIGKIHKTIAKY